MSERALRISKGFTLLEMLGVLAIMAILLSIMAPAVIGRIKEAKREAERKNLEAIGRGIELYLQKNRAWPGSLAALSPEYVPFASTQLTANSNGYPRYYVVHPNVSSLDNATGLSESQLADARFLLISHLSQDAAPSITTGAQFESWWDTDETATADLLMYRGHVGHLFILLSLSADGAGGSYAIDGSATNSGGGTLPVHTKYHLLGTSVGLDEASTYASPEVTFSLTEATGYRFDPDCAAGSKWRVISSGCYPG
ncbi:MAG: prepilin-type N-terminal cleavage/methylation domain-containing protein [Nitrospirae bacterium]|nr:MAG: prepilin-type N-terminal cleavage/methylation domain-containing protein [Nitrospirota bacterium]